MTLRHKIKLIWCRFNWWLKITEEAEKHYKSFNNYIYLLELYKEYKAKLLLREKTTLKHEEILELKSKVELLAEILDIRQ